jgi:hypothetical protein
LISICRSFFHDRPTATQLEFVTPSRPNSDRSR